MSRGSQHKELSGKLKEKNLVEEHKTPPKRRSTRNLRKRAKPAVKDASSISSHLGSDESFSVSGKKRKRKNPEQLNILLKHFKLNPKWDKETVDNAAQESGLDRSQVYKWGWDRKKKADDLGIEMPSNDEWGGYKKHDFLEGEDPIASLINIDVNKLIRTLPLTPFQDQKESEKQGKENPKKGKTKKRDRKMRHKLLEEDSDQVKHLKVSESPKLTKDVQIQTPVKGELDNVGYHTPVKTLNGDSRSSKEHLDGINKNLFPLGSESHIDPGWKSERNRPMASENSFSRRMKQCINTKDIMCSEDLSLRKSMARDENTNIMKRPIERAEDNSMMKPVLPQEIGRERKPFGQIDKRLSNTPEANIPQEDKLLDFGKDDLDWAVTVKPLSLLDFDNFELSEEDRAKQIVPFVNFCKQEEEEKENEEELVNNRRYPSFQGYQSDSEEMEDRLLSPDISLQL